MGINLLCFCFSAQRNTVERASAAASAATYAGQQLFSCAIVDFVWADSRNLSSDPSSGLVGRDDLNLDTVSLIQAQRVLPAILNLSNPAKDRASSHPAHLGVSCSSCCCWGFGVPTRSPSFTGPARNHPPVRVPSRATPLPPRLRISSSLQA